MLIDLSNTSSPAILPHYDTVIAGTGPAGMTVALELAESGKKVALLEAGGLEYSAQSQDQYLMDDMSGPWDAFVYNRLRYLGGTSNHWSGRCRPFDPYDFEEKGAFYQESGWPISFEEIDAYLPRAKKLLELDVKAPFVPKEGSLDIDNFHPDVFLKSPPTRFNQKYLEYLKSSNYIDLFINANLVDIILQNDLETVDRFKVKNYEGSDFFFQGDSYVLACGAMETPRVLLNSDTQIENGLGNNGDMVGRCFMEHFNIRLLDFFPSTEPWEGIEGMQFYTKHEFSREFEIGCSNISMSPGGTLQVSGRAQWIKKFLAKRACESGRQEALARVFSSFKCPGQGNVGTLMEQFPSRSNRVFLAEEVDLFGKRKLDFVWSLTESDARTIRVLAEQFAISATEQGLGRYKLPEWVLDDSKQIPVMPHAHHMGTTRMAKSDQDGVVDSDCLVFGTENLYIAGASVFPRGGANNPTMPGVQLALRLADHLVRRSE